MKKNSHFFPFLTSFSLLLFSGCVSMFERAGQILDGSAFAERTIAVYRSQDMEIRKVQSRDGEYSVKITLEKFPEVKLRGTFPDSHGLFFLTSLDYLGGNEHGWNEWRLDISAAGNFKPGEEAAVFALLGEIEPVQISAGRIHRFDTRITGDEALTSLRNRRERILALIEWMGLESGVQNGLGERDFNRYWKPVLFPEAVSARRRPENWQREGDRWERAEDIRWNTSYTERVFPQELWQARNSGTLLRDWEEALSWIYLKYEWGNINALLSTETVLQRTR